MLINVQWKSHFLSTFWICNFNWWYRLDSEGGQAVIPLFNLIPTSLRVGYTGWCQFLKEFDQFERLISLNGEAHLSVVAFKKILLQLAELNERSYLVWFGKDEITTEPLSFSKNADTLQDWKMGNWTPFIIVLLQHPPMNFMTFVNFLANTFLKN